MLDDTETTNGPVTCSFCGKSQDQVKKIVAGPGVYICNECIDLCKEIIDEEFKDEAFSDLLEVPKPKEILAILNDYVIGQTEAKKKLYLSQSTTITSGSTKCQWPKKAILNYKRVILR